MKRFILAVALVLTAIWSLNVLAENIGVVDMQQIFRSSPQVKKINDMLAAKFSSRREEIIKMGKQLQEDVQKYQKNKAIMNNKDVADLESKINDEEGKLRQTQTQFQQELFRAQDQEMTKFMDQIRSIVKDIAAEKKFSVILPKNAVLYSDSNLDVTSEVLDKLK